VSPPTPIKNTQTTLRGARLFRGVDPGTITTLADSAHNTTLKEGGQLWHAGDTAHHFTVIQRGLVQIERRMPSGEPAIVGVFGPRESVGDAAALAGAPYPAAAVAASERVEVVQIPRDVIVHAMQRDAALAGAVQTALLEHTQALTAKIDIVSAGSVPARLATLLLHLAERFGDETEDGLLAIPVSLSRVALSRLVSARVETVIRALSAWNKSGLVHTTDDGFEIGSPEELREVARQG
jgi:CRP-like cAMP-binding protein